MKALSYKPIAFFKCDDISPFQDYAGRNKNAFVVGTETHGIPLTFDATYSQRFGRDNPGYFDVDLVIKGREKQHFSFSITVYPTPGRSTQQILCRPGNYELLSINGTVLSFSTEYVNTGVAKCSYDIGFARKMNIVAVHTDVKNSLYVDGKLVDEIDITPAQQLDSYKYPQSDIRFQSGYSTTNDPILVNNVAFYAKALQTEEIVALHNYTISSFTGVVPKSFLGEDVFTGQSVRVPYLNTVWESANDWSQALLNNTVVDNEQISSAMLDKLTIGGTWIDSIDLYNGPTPNQIECVNMFWEGIGETVEVSLDGTNWTTAVKNQNLSIIPSGFDPTDKALYVRITFAAGLPEAFVDNMVVRGYIGNYATTKNRNLYYRNTINLADKTYDPFFRDDWGTKIDLNGNITISRDVAASTSDQVRTVEVWFKSKTTSTGTSTYRAIADLRSAGKTDNPYFGYINNQIYVTSTNADYYIDGVAVATNQAPPTVNEWHLLHIVAKGSTEFTNDTLFLNSDYGGSQQPHELQVAKVAYYPSVLSQANINTVLSNYTGITKSTFDGTGTIIITEVPASTTTYAHDWSKTST